MATKPTTLLPFVLFFTLLSATLVLSQHGSELQRCMQQCEERHPGDRQRLQECHRTCQKEYSKQEPGSQGKNQVEGDENPYFFGRERFKDWMSSQHGKIQILERFDKRSDLLVGIANYRVKILEAEPHTFVVPKHTDAEELCYVAKGEGVISLLHEDRRESHELRQGDIVRVPAGTIVYIINKHSKEKLCLVKLLQPVSTPGRFETFFDAGGENPEGYFRTFSDQVKQAAFNAPQERIERVFGKQNKGVIFKASEEQIKQLSSSSSEGGAWPFRGGESQQQRPFNLLKKRPSHKNDRGEHYEADESDYKQLRDVDVQISYANITGGSMMEPYFNARAMMVSVVVSGKGYVEIVCPHLASEQSKGQGKEEQHGRKGQDEQSKGQGKEEQHGRKGQKQGEEQEQEQQGRQQGREEQQGQKEQEQQERGEQQGREEQQGQKEQEQQGRGEQQGPKEQEQQGRGEQQRQKEQEQQGGKRYQRARANLSPGTVVVTPAGHPSAWIASRGENLEVVCFEINARNNVRYWLAGKNSILKKLEKAAKELAFGAPVKEVDALFDAQKAEVFVPGPEDRSEGRGREGMLESILEFAGP